MKKTTGIFTAISALLVLIISNVPLAQAQTSDDSLLLEEVVVTARKRSENLQDVPASAHLGAVTFLHQHPPDPS